jgi:hypothetical protein
MDRKRFKGEGTVNLGDLIPSLRRINVRLEHREAETLSCRELEALFFVLEELFRGMNAVEEQAEWEQCQNTFLRRRLLASWRLLRRKREHLACGREQCRVKIHRELFAEIRPILARCVAEESGNEADVVGFLDMSVFLWNQARIARCLKRQDESRSWEEMLEMMEDVREELHSA